jgi:protein O-mannosyl-transferase
MKWRNAAIALVLAAAALCVYAPMRQAEFIGFDDPGYYYDRPPVQTGLTPKTLWWALTSVKDEFNWHPLTWCSLMLDHDAYQGWRALFPNQELMAGEAGFVHTVSVLFHAANTVLLFLVLLRLTKSCWPSAVVAALFALHPLHVESVAWVSERKDVLSALFWILTMGAYARYAERQTWQRYTWVCVGLLLGLMSKPMVVTLPFVLLLLDLWPLGRLRLGRAPEPAAAPPKADKGGKAVPVPVAAEEGAPATASGWVRLRGSAGWPLAEKTPMFLMILGSSIATFLIQQRTGAMKYGERIAFDQRLANLPVSYATYLYKTFVPTDLSVFYPYDLDLPFLKVAGAALLLAAVTALVVWQIRRRPYLAVGWLWFLGTLVPVIGLAQVGAQAMADRYTYLPIVGVFIMGVWGAMDLLARWPMRAVVLGPLAVGVVTGLLILTVGQVRLWSDTKTLFEHSLALEPHNAVAHSVLGESAFMKGRYAEAEEHFRKSLDIDWEQTGAHNNLGWSLARRGKLDEAVYHYTESLRIDETNAAAHNNYALALGARHQFNEAIVHLKRALELDPSYVAAHNNLGMVLAELGQWDAAVEQYGKVLENNDKDLVARNNLALALSSQGKPLEALREIRLALDLAPNYPESHSNLGLILARMGRFADAISEYRRALEAAPDLFGARYNLALALIAGGDPDGAIPELRRLIRAAPGNGDVRISLARALWKQGKPAEALAGLEEGLKTYGDWVPGLCLAGLIYASDPDPAIQNVDRAVTLATRACELTKRQDPASLDALAAVYAALGRFEDALATARDAEAKARARGRPDVLEQITAHVKLYEAGKPLRQRP